MKKTVLKILIALLIFSGISFAITKFIPSKHASASYSDGNTAVILRQNGTIGGWMDSPGSYITYDSDNKRFIFNNLGMYYNGTCSAMIFIEGKQTIELRGTNTIECAYDDMLGNLIYSNEEVTFTGNGSLDLVLSTTYGEGAAISGNKITIDNTVSSVTINTTGNARGIVGQEFYQEGSNVTINTKNGHGFYISSPGSTVAPTISLTGGTMNIKTEGGHSFGIYLEGYATYVSEGGETVYKSMGRLILNGCKVFSTSKNSEGTVYTYKTEVIRNHDQSKEYGAMIYGSEDYDDTSFIKSPPSSMAISDQTLTGYWKAGWSNYAKSFLVQPYFYHDNINFEKTISTKEELLSLFSKGGEAHLVSDIDLTDEENSIVIPSEKTVTLCLGKYTIKANESNTINGNLTLYSCYGNGKIEIISKNKGTDSSISVIGTTGLARLYLYGAKIVSRAGTPALFLGNRSLFEMNDGEIFNSVDRAIPEIVSDHICLYVGCGSKSNLYSGRIYREIPSSSNASKDYPTIFIRSSYMDNPLDNFGRQDILIYPNSENKKFEIRNDYNGEAIYIQSGKLELKPYDGNNNIFITSKNNATMLVDYQSDDDEIAIDINNGVLTNESESTDPAKCANIKYESIVKTNGYLKIRIDRGAKLVSKRNINIYYKVEKEYLDPVSFESYYNTSNEVHIYSAFNNDSKEEGERYDLAKYYSSADKTIDPSFIKGSTISESESYYMEYDTKNHVAYSVRLAIAEDPSLESMKVEAKESGATYQWYLKKDESFIEVEGETSSALSDYTSGTYICKVSYKEASVNSDELVIPEYTVSFNSNDGTSVESQTVVYGKCASLPENPTKTSYSFRRWMVLVWDGLSLKLETYDFSTPVESDLQLIADWKEKMDATVLPTVSTYEYGRENIAYKVDTTPTALNPNTYSVTYFAGGEWTNTAPIEPGVYKVRIERSEDDLYKAYSKEIDLGLYIYKRKIESSSIDVIRDKGYVYDGTDKSESVSAKYTNVNGEKVSLKLLSIKIEDGNIQEFKNAGTYVFTYSLDTDLEKSRYTLYQDYAKEGETEYSETHKYDFYKDVDSVFEVRIEISKARVEITQSTNEFQYDGEEKTFLITGDTDKVQTSDTTKGINAGTYSVSYTLIDQANYEFGGGVKTSFDYVITPIKVTTPTVEKEYTYTGLEQTVEVSGVNENMTTDDSLKFIDSGSYSITYSLIDSTNYVWLDEKAGVVEFSVKKADASIDTSLMVTEKPYSKDGVAFNEGATLNHTEAEIAYQNYSFDYPGEYKVKVCALETKNYNAIEIEVDVTVTKAKIKEPTVTNTPVYDGLEHDPIFEGYTDLIETTSIITRTNAGTYKIWFSIKAPDLYEWDIDSDGEVFYTIEKANVDIDVDQTPITIRYGETPSFPSATASFGLKVTSDALTIDYSTLGEKTIHYTVDSSANYNGAVKEVKVTVIKGIYDMSEITFTDKYFLYDGESKSIYINGILPEGLEVDYVGNGVSKVGNHKVTAVFTSDDLHEEVEPMEAYILIKQVNLESDEEGKKTIVLEYSTGFEFNVSLEFKSYTSESDLSNLMINYNDILKDNEEIGFIYDIKILITLEDGTTRYLSQDDIEEGHKLTVKLLLPTDIDRSKIKKIAHVHSKDDITYIDFDSSSVYDGYYEIEISKLSEFALIVEKGTTKTNIFDFTKLLNLDKKYYYGAGCAGIALIAMIILISAGARKRKKKKSMED